jgi:hypothetical protein
VAVEDLLGRVEEKVGRTLVVFRCTQRVIKRFRLEPEAVPPTSSCLLGDWYANLLNVGPARFVLCLSERSLLPVILPARNGVFPQQFPEFLREVLQALHVAPERVHAEVVAVSETAFAKPRSRSVLGTLNDFGFHAWHYIADPQWHDTPLQAALKLAEMPSKAIGYNSPDRIVHSLFEGSGPS